MKKALLITFFLHILTSTALFSQCGNLYIGGVIDGPLLGGTPKGIQICATADVTDLSIYGLGSANNGGGTDGQEFTFPADAVSAGDCFWVGSGTTNWITWFGFEPCYTSTAANINGDDAIELFCSGAVEDLLGDQNVDGTGECWEHLDGWAVNNSGGPNFGAFDCADWSFSGPNALDGESSNATAATPYPSPTQTCPGVLPVTLTTFTAIDRNKNIELSWTTLLEINNNYFDIQRSRDGINFETIGSIKGSGNSTKQLEYTFVDENPFLGVNYYRLKQVDFDGKFEYSDIIKANNKTGKIKTYPTLVTNNLTIEIDNSELTQITFINSVGESLKKKSLHSSINVVDISDLPTGVYFIKLESSSHYHIERIVKN